VPEERPAFEEWRAMALKIDSLDKEVNICMVGKYLPGTDSYLSVMKATEHSSHKVGAKLNLTWIDASHLEDKECEKNEESWNRIKAADGIIVPGGFGGRGIEGMILAIQYAREKKVPYLGVCLGL
jgi:CTP synthase